MLAKPFAERIDKVVMSKLRRFVLSVIERKSPNIMLNRNYSIQKEDDKVYVERYRAHPDYPISHLGHNKEEHDKNNALHRAAKEGDLLKIFNTETGRYETRRVAAIVSIPLNSCSQEDEG